ncbi:MAG: hypothetical protein LBM06_04170 [Prevotellaceae bacterium]|jgi:hypothetical protein|nr:hypothetical protein [Prevotellaceae bacterium]
MKQTKTYFPIEPEKQVVHDPTVAYRSGGSLFAKSYSNRKGVDKSFLPGQFSEAEKDARLKAAVDSFRSGKGITEEEMDIFFDSLV